MIPQAEALQIGLGAWMAAIAGVVIFRMLSGQISLNGLLSCGIGSGADRTQMLVLSLSGAAAYLGAAIKMGGLPEVPDWALVIGGASQGVYLAGKQARTT